MAKHQWIPETEAAQKLGFKHPRTLRRYAKSGKLDITYTNIHGRHYQYDERSIDKVLAKHAHIIS